ncbi:MAG: M24 family metallopeptidase [Candidatus Thorarchaeota archaeon]
MLDRSVYAERLTKVTEYIESQGADFAVLTPSPNFMYLTGIDYEMRERLLALVVQPNKDPFIISPAFEASDHASHTWIEDIVTWQEDENPYTMLAQTVGVERHQSKVLIDDRTPLRVYWALEKAVGGFAASSSLTPVIDELRLLKSREELDLMKKAGHIIDDAVMKAFSEARVGMTELEVKQIVINEILRQGATVTFAAVQFGPNSALPHADSGPTALGRGDVVLMDCGCAVEGYNTDQTRVGIVGEPSSEVERVYSTVLSAEETAIESIRPGLACGAADGIARRVIEDAGYGEFFTHRLGHGIGIEVHEPPYIVRGNPQELAPGMCHSVEPGVYLEGRFGIRMEDLVCISEDGCDVLTYSPKELYEIQI